MNLGDSGGAVFKNYELRTIQVNRNFKIFKHFYF